MVVPQWRRFPEGMMGGELTDRFREQSLRFGTKIYSETVTKVPWQWLVLLVVVLLLLR